MSDLQALADAITAATHDGELALRSSLIPYAPLGSFVDAQPDGVLALRAVTTPQIAGNTLTFTATLGALPVPWIGASFGAIDATFTVTDTAGTLTAMWSTATAALPAGALPAIAFPHGELADVDGISELELTQGKIAPSATLDVNGWLSASTGGRQSAFLPSAIAGLAPWLFAAQTPTDVALSLHLAPFPTSELALRFALSASLSLPTIGTAVAVTGLELVTRQTSVLDASRPPVTAIEIIAHGTITLPKVGTVGISLDVTASIWTLTIDTSTVDLDELAALAGWKDAHVTTWLGDIHIADPKVQAIRFAFDVSAMQLQRAEVDLAVTFFGAQLTAMLELVHPQLRIWMTHNEDDPAHQANTISLQKVFAMVPVLSGISLGSENAFLDGFTLLIAPGDSHYEVGATCSSTISANIGTVRLALTELGFQAATTGGAASGSVFGAATAGSFLVDAMVSGATDQGWTISMACTQETPADVGDLLAWFERAVGIRLEAPAREPFPIRLSSARLEYATHDESFSAYAELQADLTILDKLVTVDGVVYVATAKQADGTRTYTLDFQLPWHIGDAALAISYRYDSAADHHENVLEASWQEAPGKKVTLDDVLSALHIDLGSDGLKDVAHRLSPALEGVYFRFDIDDTHLVIAAEASVGSGADLVDGVLLLEVGQGVKGNEGTHTVVLGMAVESRDGLTLKDLPLMREKLEPLSFIALDEACILVADPALTAYQPATLPFYGTAGKDPFAAIADAGSIAVNPKGNEVAVIAAAVFSLAKLGTSHREIARMQQLLANNGVRDQLVLLGEVSVGPSTSIKVEAELDVHVTLHVGNDRLLIESAFVSFGYDSGVFSFTIGGTFGVRVRVDGTDRTFTEQVYLAITEAEVTAGVTIHVTPNVQLAPLNLFMSEVDADIAITFEPPAIGVGLEAKLTAGKKNPKPALDVAAIVTVDYAGEAAYPNIPVFMISIPSLTYELVLDILGVKKRPRAADFLSGFALYEFYVGWAESPGYLLPDRNAMPAGLAVQGMIRIAAFEGWLALDLSGSDQKFEMSCKPIHWNGLELGGDGKEINIDVVDVTIGGNKYEQPVMDSPPPKHSHPKTVVPAHGPSIKIDLEKQPFIDLGLKVRLFDEAPVAATKVVVGADTVTFELELKLPRILGRDRLTMRCGLLHDPTGKQVTGFSTKTRIWFEEPKIPVIDKLERFRGWLKLEATIDEHHYELNVEAWIHFHFVTREHVVSWAYRFTEPVSLDKLAERVAKEIERAIKEIIE